MATEQPTNEEVARQLVEAFATRDPRKIMELYADDFEVVAPFMFPRKLVFHGKRQLEEILRENPDSIKARMYDDIRVTDLTVLQTVNPEWIVIEWTYVSRIGDDEVENGNVCIAQVRHGKILRSRDYHNHVTRAVADGKIPQLLKLISSMELEQDRNRRTAS